MYIYRCEAEPIYIAVGVGGGRGGSTNSRASPGRPPRGADDAVMRVELPAAAVTSHAPTLVVWAEDDIALPVALLDGLEEFVPRLRVVRVPDATHWIVHERPALVIAEIERELGG
jgi:pimeloyl-ACP methyl ester carboxylesterase